VQQFMQQQWPEGSPLPEILYDPRVLAENAAQRVSLHAKGVVIDHVKPFVSSANFTEAAQLRNIELGW
jgi:phosphatidylserine/phosphatidylglycerophosphate/cardiolipin synthase-like enzyme